MIMQRLSPLTRGTHGNGCDRQRDPRFIPAGAGNTASDYRSVAIGAVYPRWRGEHTDKQPHSLFRFDLSLLARGTLLNNVVNSVSWRFIPAGAGNTISPSALTSPSTVYPRWRGEHVLKNSAKLNCDGLSPLARGTHGCERIEPVKNRFIPAGAGNTRRPAALTSARAVYPRWRGEHSISVPPTSTARGLSPLARGTLLERIEHF